MKNVNETFGVQIHAILKNIKEQTSVLSLLWYLRILQI